MGSWRETARLTLWQKSLPARNPEGKCYNCRTVESTQWRRGWAGMRTLCNSCGIRYAKVSGL